ncbi:hypothetical protein FB567DRAFT_325440 [Paraphoma chrysanthemicola]|uniref:Uncharacterized protein n=1 Tax=Paraphoma chrysanthemicola TaxID=798071 RepID=A0A8K0VZV3_9PLEO|nr:hypothetical protein FB567DRAFT_325440 [Paraphoma chrysanthemicola]
MPYLVHHSSHSRPYFTVHAFLAQDFQHWGYMVTTYPSSSPYINVIRHREQHLRLVRTRPTLMELWARELFLQDHNLLRTNTADPHETRNSRVSQSLESFVRAVAEIGRVDKPKKASRWSAQRLKVKNTPLPDDPGEDLAVRYMRLLRSVQLTRNAELPTGLENMSVSHADMLTLEFLPNDSLQRKHCIEALVKVQSGDGQMAAVPEIYRETGVVKLKMWVEVSDCVVGEEGAEPLPLYDGVQGPPEYEE